MVSRGDGMKKRVLASGSLVLDILPRFLPVTGCELVNTLLAEGRLTESPEIIIYDGGSVGNTGLALAKLGLNVTVKSKVGDDVVGTVVKSLIASMHVNERISVVPSGKSTASIALAIPGRDKSTIHQRGVSQLLKADDFTEDDFKDIDLFHLGYPTTMKYLYAHEGSDLVKILTMAHEQGVITSLDTSLPDLNSEPGKVDWRPILKRLFPVVDLFLPSIEEAVFMMDRDRYVNLVKTARGKDFIVSVSDEEIRTIADRAIQGGVKVVLIKCGKRGMYLRTMEPAFVSKEWHHRELWCTPYEVAKIVSTTGAGDTAIAGFLCGMLEGMSPEKSLLLGSICASRCIASYDTVSGLEDVEVLKTFLAKTKHVVYLPQKDYWKEKDQEGIFYGNKDLHQ